MSRSFNFYLFRLILINIFIFLNIFLYIHWLISHISFLLILYFILTIISSIQINTITIILSNFSLTRSLPSPHIIKLTLNINNPIFLFSRFLLTKISIKPLQKHQIILHFHFRQFINLKITIKNILLIHSYQCLI